MNRQKSAFTLTELILVVIFLGIFAAISIPRLNFAVVSKQIADSHAKKIVTDLRRTRSLAISNAAENTTGFARVTDPKPRDSNPWEHLCPGAGIA